MPINFKVKGTDFRLQDTDKYRQWLKDVIKMENHVTGEINYLFVNDEILLEANKKFLNHDYFTDVITFDNSKKAKIAGDVMISIDRVKENATKFLPYDFNVELKRVMVHAVLHLLGYKDKKETDKAYMSFKEDAYIDMFPK